MRIPLRKMQAASALFLDYLDDSDRVQRFYPEKHSIESLIRYGRNRPKLDGAHLDVLCTVLRSQQVRFGGVQRGVDKLAAGAVAVVTGQQAGLFTGPLLSIFKAISAIKIAKELEREGIAAVPIFWIASEDHDLAEIESAWILNQDSGLSRISAALSTNVATPACWAMYGADIQAAIDGCFSVLPESEFRTSVQQMVRSCYQPGISPVDGFGRMMARLFVESDLTFIDPMHPEFRRISQPVIRDAVRRNAALRTAVLAQSKALSDAGYHAQVKVDQSFTGLFAFREKARVSLRPQELDEQVLWSPNVLLRPVMQDFLLPTVTYVAGPAEIAYFGQASAVYQTLERPMPPISPRISASIVEPRVRRVLQKYGFEFTDVFEGREFLKRKAVGTLVDVDAFDRAKAVMAQQLELLTPPLGAVDVTLLGALRTSQHKVAHQVESLRVKYIHAAARQSETLERHLDTVEHSLFPDKKLQERVLNVVSYLACYGPGLIRLLEDRLSIETAEHQLVEI